MSVPKYDIVIATYCKIAVQATHLQKIKIELKRIMQKYFLNYFLDTSVV